MVKNAPTLAIGGVDTAENGPFLFFNLNPAPVLICLYKYPTPTQADSFTAQIEDTALIEKLAAAYEQHAKQLGKAQQGRGKVAESGREARPSGAACAKGQHTDRLQNLAKLRRFWTRGGIRAG